MGPQVATHVLITLSSYVVGFFLCALNLPLADLTSTSWCMRGKILAPLSPTSEAFFKINLNVYLDTLILYMYVFLHNKTNNFRSDLTDTLAEKSSLSPTWHKIMRCSFGIVPLISEASFKIKLSGYLDTLIQ